VGNLAETGLSNAPGRPSPTPSMSIFIIFRFAAMTRFAFSGSSSCSSSGRILVGMGYSSCAVGYVTRRRLNDAGGSFVGGDCAEAFSGVVA
jgi:hypothetical protein